MANRIVLELLADANPMIKGLNAAQSQLNSFMKSADGVGASLGGGVNRALDTFKNLAGGGTQAAGVLAGAFAVAATAAFSLTARAGQTAEETERLAQKTGIAASSLEGLSVAMARDGLEAASIATAVKGLAKSMGDMESGSGAGKKALESLGVTLETVKKGTGATMKAVADGFAKMPDGAEKARIAVELFGKAGLDLIPMLNKGSKGLDEAMKKSAEFGLILTDTARGDLSIFADTMDDLGSAMKGFTMQVGAAFAPALTAIINAVTQAIVRAKDIFNSFADAAATLTIRLAGMVTSLQLLGSQLFSTSVLSKEAWKQTLEQVKAVDAWATSERDAVKAARESESQLATLAQKHMDAAKAVDKHAASQERLAKAQAAKEAAMKAMASDIEIGMRQAAFAQEKKEAAMKAMAVEMEIGQRQRQHAQDVSRQIFAETFAEDARRMKDTYAGSATMIENVTTKQKALRDMQSDIQKGLDAQQASVPQVGSVWATTMEQVQQAGTQAFGLIRNQFGQAVAGMVLGTQTFQQFMNQMYSTLINMSVQFGINQLAEWVKQQAAQLAVDTATQAGRVGINSAGNAAIVGSNAASAGATVGIWQGAGAAIIGTFGVITGAIQGFFMSTLLPFFAAIGKALMAFLSAIAAAAKVTIFGIPYGVAILAGVAVIGAAIGSLMAFAFDKGGIATGPTFGMIGEAGSSEAVIPLNRRGAAFMREALGGGGGEPVVVHVQIGDDLIVRKVARQLPSAIRLRGVPIR